MKYNFKHVPPLPFCFRTLFLFISDCNNADKGLYFALNWSVSQTGLLLEPSTNVSRLARCFMNILPVLVNDCKQNSKRKAVEVDDFRVFFFFVQVLVGHDDFLCILNGIINATG